MPSTMVHAEFNARPVRRGFLFVILLGTAVSVFTAYPIPQKSVRGTEDARLRMSGEKSLSGRRDDISGREVIAAFYDAYPDRVAEKSFRDGDWALRIDDEWFYWAEGRLLPEDLRFEWRSYSPHPFYRYPPKLPPLPDLSDEQKSALAERLSSREENPPSRHPGLFNALWDLYDQDSSWRKVKTTYFLGLKTQIHRTLLEDLAAVEEELFDLADENEEVRIFISSIVQLEGYSWRRISGTASLSFHSYGTAVDILPRSYSGKQAYWRWAMVHYEEWYSIPYEKRFTPPAEFIKVFEKHGFIWGGKWFYFDTIHFEYRPEILALGRADRASGAF